MNALTLNNEIYLDAIALLKKGLDCPRHIASCHSLAIISYPKITKGPPTALTVTSTRGSTDQSNPVRQCAPQRQAFTATQAPSTCSTCRWPRTIWRCDTFKAKPFSERLKDVKGILTHQLPEERTFSHVTRTENGITRYCIRSNTIQSLVPAYSSRKSSPSNSPTATSSSQPYSSSTRHRKSTTNHRSELPRTNSYPSPSFTHRRTYNQ